MLLFLKTSLILWERKLMKQVLKPINFKRFCFLFIFMFGFAGFSLFCVGFLLLWRVGATPHCDVRGFLIPVAPLAMEHKL